MARLDFARHAEEPFQDGEIGPHAYLGYREKIAHLRVFPGSVCGPLAALETQWEGLGLIFPAQSIGPSNEDGINVAQVLLGSLMCLRGVALCVPPKEIKIFIEKSALAEEQHLRHFSLRLIFGLYINMSHRLEGILALARTYQLPVWAYSPHAQLDPYLLASAGFRPTARHVIECHICLKRIDLT